MALSPSLATIKRQWVKQLLLGLASWWHSLWPSTEEKNNGRRVISVTRLTQGNHSRDFDPGERDAIKPATRIDFQKPWVNDLGRRYMEQPHTYNTYIYIYIFIHLFNWFLFIHLFIYLLTLIYLFIHILIFIHMCVWDLIWYTHSVHYIALNEVIMLHFMKTLQDLNLQCTTKRYVTLEDKTERYDTIWTDKTNICTIHTVHKIHAISTACNIYAIQAIHAVSATHAINTYNEYTA